MIMEALWKNTTTMDEVMMTMADMTITEGTRKNTTITDMAEVMVDDTDIIKKLPENGKFFNELLFNEREKNSILRLKQPYVIQELCHSDRSGG